MPLDFEAALERVLAGSDEWGSWRALRLLGDAPEGMPAPHDQDDEGGFRGHNGSTSPGATGEAVCHLVSTGLGGSGAAAIAADWLEQSRTPAGAWLDAPSNAPAIDEAAGARVWATAAASCALLALGRDPGARALQLLRAEADVDGRFTGGAYPTFAAAGVYWIAHGPQSEMAEWALRWAREYREEWWGPWERVTALTFWAAAAVPSEHPSVEEMLDELQSEAPSEGWSDLELTLRSLELVRHLDR